MRHLTAVLFTLLILECCIFWGVERCRYQSRIRELECMLQDRQEAHDFPPYIEGVKVGLKFKKRQLKGMPCAAAGLEAR